MDSFAEQETEAEQALPVDVWLVRNPSPTFVVLSGWTGET